MALPGYHRCRKGGGSDLPKENPFRIFDCLSLLEGRITVVPGRTQPVPGRRVPGESQAGFGDARYGSGFLRCGSVLRLVGVGTLQTCPRNPPFRQRRALKHSRETALWVESRVIHRAPCRGTGSRASSTGPSRIPGQSPCDGGFANIPIGLAALVSGGHVGLAGSFAQSVIRPERAHRTDRTPAWDGTTFTSTSSRIRPAKR